jgi:ABC-2 type transport system permease protein
MSATQIPPARPAVPVTADVPTRAATRVPGLPLVATALRQRRRGLLFWSLGIGAVVLMYLPLYPSMQGSLQTQIDALPEGVAQAFGMSSMDAAGYAQSTVYGLLGAILIIVFAITAGGRAVAGEEETGLLDLYLAHGVSRQRLMAERTLHLLIELTVLAGVVVGLTLIINPGAELDLSLEQVLAAGTGLLGLGVVTGVVGLAAGAATGSRGAAMGAATVVGVGGYLANVIGDIAELPWLKDVSPFHWAYGFEPLRNGVDGGATLLLLYGTAAVAYLVGAALFARRDIGT